MAIIKTSSIISDIKGSIGGNTFQQSKSGLVLRTKPSSCNKNSNAQNSARLNLAYVSKSWNSLTDAQRNSWAKFANMVKIHQIGNYGKYIGGYECFLKVNCLRYKQGFAIMEDPVFTIEQVTDRSGLCSAELTTSYFFVDSSIDWTSEACQLQISLQVRTPNGSNKVNYFDVYLSHTEGVEYDITSEVQRIWGSIFTTQSKFHFRYRMFSLLNGCINGWCYGFGITS